MSNNQELNDIHHQVINTEGIQQEQISSPPLDLSVNTTRSETPNEELPTTLQVSKSEAIVAAAIEAGYEVFLDQYADAFAWLPVAEPEPHHECLKIGTSDFQFQLLKLRERHSKETPKPGTLKEASKTLKLLAIRNGRKELANRVTYVDGKILIDQADQAGRAIEVDKTDWKVTSLQQPRFIRYKHQMSLPIPSQGGDWRVLFNLLNLEQESERLLVLVWLLSTFHAGIQSPMLLLAGPQGSAKTTISRRLRGLTDPSVTAVLGDTEVQNLFQTFHSHAVPCFENVAQFNRKTADMFCRAVTGTGVERRKLFTDSDQVLYQFRRSIIINGIGIPSHRPDFLERCIIVRCKRVESFQLLKTLDQDFEEMRPQLFGSLLTLLSKTLSTLESTPVATEFRMADFAHFGRAVARAIGSRDEDFDLAYRMNIAEQTTNLLDNSLVATLLAMLVAKGSLPWDGTATKLLVDLTNLAKTTNFLGAKAKLPANARWLASELDELAPSLLKRGIVISRGNRTNEKRIWIVDKAPSPPPAYLDKLK